MMAAVVRTAKCRARQKRELTMAGPTRVKSYTVEYAGDVLLDKHGAALIRFESAANEHVSVLMGRRLLEHLLLDIQDVLANKFLSPD
jgi:hypothetical protein